MLIRDLPDLPSVSALRGGVFQRVFHLWAVSEAKRPHGLEFSQRQMCSRFNRSGQRTVSKYLKSAREMGLIELRVKSDRLNPDVYRRGPFFTQRTRDSERLIRLSNGLWGAHDGILTHWPFPTSWGHGCVPPAVNICLATLNVLEEPIRREHLREYLSGFVPISSFNSAFRWIRSRNLVIETPDGFLLEPDWADSLLHVLSTKPAGFERHDKGDARRRGEAERNRSRILKTTLTENERTQLRRLPCVHPHCKSEALELEHFPPRRYLRHFHDQTNQHLVWAICEEHNDKTVEFIKSLSGLSPVPPLKVVLGPRADPAAIYFAASNFHLERFYAAYRKGDHIAAEKEVKVTLQLWTALGDQVASLDSVVQNQKSRLGRTRGPNANPTEDSKLFPNRLANRKPYQSRYDMKSLPARTSIG